MTLVSGCAPLSTGGSTWAGRWGARQLRAQWALLCIGTLFPARSCLEGQQFQKTRRNDCSVRPGAHCLGGRRRPPAAATLCECSRCLMSADARHEGAAQASTQPSSPSLTPPAAAAAVAAAPAKAGVAPAEASPGFRWASEPTLEDKGRRFYAAFDAGSLRYSLGERWIPCRRPQATSVLLTDVGGEAGTNTSPGCRTCGSDSAFCSSKFKGETLDKVCTCFLLPAQVMSSTCGRLSMGHCPL